ncbi:MAG: hybrid sensor histidine kinase/response regulator [Armatimonadetes bacterium]|nr:hybrid sensor histidine kinase/response regulator [Armatimonadota bacterium]
MIGGQGTTAQMAQRAGHTDQQLMALAAICLGSGGRETRAEAVARLLAEPDHTVAVRWLEPAGWTLLAAAGPQSAAMKVAEPEWVIERLAARVDAFDLDDEAVPNGAWRTLVTAVGLRCVLILPLAVEGHVIGLVSIYTEDEGGWFGFDRERWTLTASLVTHALLVDAQVVITPTDIGDEEGYRRAVSELHARRDAEDASRQAAGNVARLLRANFAMVARCEDGLDRFEVHLPIERFTISAAEAPQVFRAASEQAVLVESPGTEPSDRVGQMLREAHVQRAVFQPLVFDRRLFGVLVVGFGQADQISRRSRKMLDRLSFHISLALRDAGLLRAQEEALERLHRAQDAATEGAKFRALAQMAGGVAHEFNNALGGILGRAQMLQRQTSDHRIHKGLRTIFEIGWRAAETVRRLQEFTRERSEEDLQPINVASVWQRLEDAARAQLAEVSKLNPAKYHIELNPGQLDGVLLANPDELAEAVGNVLRNACESMPSGGVVALNAHVATEHLFITVVDRGRGMSTEEQQSIFDPFYSTKAETGVGLGLSVTYGIITRHRGEIEVESAPNVGTTVSITLPLSAQEAEEPVTSPLRVLVIDDEEALCEVLAELFSSVGFEVDTCAGGREGIERFGERSYDLVCTDLRTDDLSGWEVIRAVKESGRGTPVMLLTGFRDQLKPEQIEQSGVDAVLGKPFTLQQVMDAADALLRR